MLHPEANHYLIVSVEDEDTCEPLYWNMDTWSWTEDQAKATRFDRRIFCAPIPGDAAGIAECDKDGNVVHFYGIAELPLVELAMNVRFYETTD